MHLDERTVGDVIVLAPAGRMTRDGELRRPASSGSRLGQGRAPEDGAGLGQSFVYG